MKVAVDSRGLLIEDDFLRKFLSERCSGTVSVHQRSLKRPAKVCMKARIQGRMPSSSASILCRAM